jgi:hypothetical protein
MSEDFIDLPQLLSARGRVRLPGSKSISNRLLLLAALARRPHRSARPACSRTIRRACSTRCRPSASASTCGPTMCSASAASPALFRLPQADLFLGNAGTAFRPLTAVLAFAGGDAITVCPACRACTSGRSPTSSTACASWAPTSNYLGASQGSRPCGLVHRPPGDQPGGLSAAARRRVEPVPDRSSDGAAAARRRDDGRSRRRADFAALRRDHAGEHGPFRRHRAARWLARFTVAGRQRVSLAGRRCRSREMPRLPPTFSRWARLAAVRCASKGSAAIRSRATSALPMRWPHGGNDHDRRQLDRGVGAVNRDRRPSAGHRHSTAITFRTRR